MGLWDNVSDYVSSAVDKAMECLGRANDNLANAAKHASEQHKMADHAMNRTGPYSDLSVRESLAVEHHHRTNAAGLKQTDPEANLDEAGKALQGQNPNKFGKKLGRHAVNPAAEQAVEALKKAVNETYGEKDVEQQKEKQDKLAPEKTEVEKDKNGGPDCPEGQV